jgi:hypothetical protein
MGKAGNAAHDPVLLVLTLAAVVKLWDAVRTLVPLLVVVMVGYALGREVGAVIAVGVVFGLRAAIGEFFGWN